MSDTTTAAVPARTAVLAVPTVAVGLVCTALGAHDWGELAVVGAGLVLVGGLVFLLAVPRARRTRSEGAWSLGRGVPAALLTLPAFWSGLPIVLGAAAVLLGNEGRLSSRGSGKAIAGLVLGSLAVIGYLAIYLGDVVVAGNRGFLFD